MFHNPWPAKIAMTIEEAAIAAGLGRRTIVRAIEQGKLPSSFVCGRRRISPRALERFMAGLPPEPADAPQMRVVSVSGPVVAAE
jgi:excisionase family DNA binding protein